MDNRNRENGCKQKELNLQEYKEYSLERQRESCDFAFEMIGAGISKHLLDENLTFLWGNASFYEQLGYTESEYQAQFPDLRHFYMNAPQEFKKIECDFYTLLRQGEKKAVCDVLMPVKGQEAVWMRMTGTVTDSPADAGPVVYIIYTDVDDMMRRAHRLQQMEEERADNFKWMMSEYAGNVYISDMDNYELLYLNKNACDTLHASMNQLIGRKCYDAIQGRMSPCPFCTNNSLKENETYAWEFYNPVLSRTFLIKNRLLNWRGRRARIELSYDMYSEEYKLAKKDQEREAILKTIPGGLARIDARDACTVLWFNGKFLDMIGYTKEQYEGELHSQCTYLHPDDLERAMKIASGLTETGANNVFEARMIKRNGEERILTVTLCYISGEDSWDGIPSLYSVGLDITEERIEQQRQRKALEEAYDSARIASMAKTNFLSSMSHDIRTPMNAIIGMATIAQANILSPEKVHDCLNKISVSSRHLLSLINEVLDMSKIESGKIDLISETVELPELIQSIYDMTKSLISSKNQEFRIVVENVIHEKVISDGERLKQIFINLISNAIKYTAEGGHIVLQIRETESLIAGKGVFEFTFMDDGIGMAEEYIPHIFEPFSRAEDTRISKIQGTGLGLAITENIVRMLNGTIEVSSELGKGSKFAVSIPLRLWMEEENTDVELSGKSVLIVDDDRIVCENAVMLLNELGVNGKWVLSGPEAIKSIKEAHEKKDDYFAVIVDWKMPGMDGLETVRLIREELEQAVPIVIISAYDLADIETEFINAGVDAFITKPLFKSKMLHVLELFCVEENEELAVEDAKGGGAELAGKRILLVEDNKLNREIARELLAMRGMAVEEATNGEEAISMFRSSEPEYYAAILMDIQMPVMNGYQATQHIRSLGRPDAQEIPIIALTANVFVSDVKAAQDAGMNDHIAKPIDVECLMHVLQKYIK